MDALKVGDRVLHNDSVLYGAPRCPETQGTITGGPYPVPKDRYPYGGNAYDVRWDNGDTSEKMAESEYRKDYGGSVESLQSDEEAADIARLGEV